MTKNCSNTLKHRATLLHEVESHIPAACPSPGPDILITATTRPGFVSEKPLRMSGCSQFQTNNEVCQVCSCAPVSRKIPSFSIETINSAKH